MIDKKELTFHLVIAAYIISMIVIISTAYATEEGGEKDLSSNDDDSSAVTKWYEAMYQKYGSDFKDCAIPDIPELNCDIVDPYDFLEGDYTIEIQKAKSLGLSSEDIKEDLLMEAVTELMMMDENNNKKEENDD